MSIFSSLSYDALIEKLFSLSKIAFQRKDLSICNALSSALSSPEKSFPSVHIAGTNGKGSVALKIAKCLQNKGLKVGLFTSPHLFTFRERIAINDQLISEKEVSIGLKKLLDLAQKLNLNPSFFELTTFLAFDYFRQNFVDIAVIETGLGGRLDATNVIHPILSVITSISREHVHILGDSLNQIAKEKAGIIKPGVPIILGPTAQLDPILQKAVSLECEVHLVQEKQKFFDHENQQIAAISLKVLYSILSLKSEESEEGLKLRPSCRFEINENVILDVAHNPQGFVKLVDALKLYYPNFSYRFVVGMSQDKEIEACLRIIGPIATKLHFVQAKTPRAATLESLVQNLKQAGNFYHSIEKDVTTGVLNAKAALTSKEVLIICGSFYIMEEAKLALLHI